MKGLELAAGATGAGLVRCGAAAKVAAVPVEVEVPVGWVVGVDEGVGVGSGGNWPPNGLDGLSHTLDRLGCWTLDGLGHWALDGLGWHEGLLGWSLLLVEPGAGLGHSAVVVLVVVVNRLPGLHKLLLLLARSRLLTRGRCRTRGGLELSRALSVGTGGHVVALQDPETVLAGGVPHRDGLACLIDVAVLADPLTVGGRLLPVNCTVLLGIGRSKPAVPSIEPLLLEDLCLLRVNELGQAGRGEAGGENPLSSL